MTTSTAERPQAARESVLMTELASPITVATSLLHLKSPRHVGQSGSYGIGGAIRFDMDLARPNSIYDFGTCNSVSVGDIPSYCTALAHRVENVLGLAVHLIRLDDSSPNISDACTKAISTFLCSDIFDGCHPDRVLSSETVS